MQKNINIVSFFITSHAEFCELFTACTWLSYNNKKKKAIIYSYGDAKREFHAKGHKEAKMKRKSRCMLCFLCALCVKLLTSSYSLPFSSIHQSVSAWNLFFHPAFSFLHPVLLPTESNKESIQHSSPTKILCHLLGPVPEKVV